MQSESYFRIAIVLLALLLLVNSLQLYLEKKESKRMEPYTLTLAPPRVGGQLSGYSSIATMAPTLKPLTTRAPGIKGRLSGNT